MLLRRALPFAARQMTRQYKAPLRDINFVLNNVVGLQEHYGKLTHSNTEGATEEMIDMYMETVSACHPFAPVSSDNIIDLGVRSCGSLRGNIILVVLGVFLSLSLLMPLLSLTACWPHQNSAHTQNNSPFLL